MKSTFIICLLIIAAVFKTYSQASIGVRGGILYTHIKGPFPSENISGWEAGIFFKSGDREQSIFSTRSGLFAEGGKTIIQRLILYVAYTVCKPAPAGRI
jgi:hypothetical protein